jgi:transposase
MGVTLKHRSAKLSAGHAAVEKTIQLAQDFAAMIRQRKEAHLDEWLQEALESGLKVILNFALTLRQDYAAVKAALSLSWSAGPTEGHNGSRQSGRPDLPAGRLVPFSKNKQRDIMTI